METGNDGHDYAAFYRAGKVRRGGRGGETIAAAKLIKVFDAPIMESEKHVGGEETRGGALPGEVEEATREVNQVGAWRRCRKMVVAH
jgi:hypothetical protein